MLFKADRQLMPVIRNAFIIFAFIFSVCSYAEVVVIVHPENSNMLDKATIKQIFMGRIKQFPNGASAVPVELASGSIRAEFLKTYLGKREGEVQSYWSRQLFTGKGMPPKSYNSEEDIKKSVASNPDVIGFIDSKSVDATVKVLKLH